MMIGAARTSGLLLVLAVVPAPVRAEPANTLSEPWRALGACARITGAPAAAAGSEVTVLFSLKRDGSLQGQPRITHSHLVGDAVTQRAFIAGALTAVARCLPVTMTDGPGGAIAGRPLRLQLTSRPPERVT